jgi:DNA-binding MarR family transcriptional regulator
MENAGFVRRRRDPDDRRRVIIELVPDGGYDSLRASLAEFSRSYTALIDQYDDAELELLLDFARRANEIVHDQTVRIRERSEPRAARRS